MANRYWVGGSGTWDTTTTHWSTSSGGAAGASAPTTADSVFFDQAGTYTVTLSGALACLDFTVSAGTVTFAAGTTPSLNIVGSLSLVTGTVWPSTTGFAVSFTSTTTGRTVTTNGTALGAIVFTSSTGGWTLGSALTMVATGAVTFTSGSLNLNGFTLTTGTFSSSNANTRTLALGAGNIVLTHTTAATTVLNMTTTTGLTLTGTGGFVTDAAITRTLTVGTTGGSAANAPNVTLTGSGTSVLTFTSGSWFNSLNFGTTAFNPGTSTLNVSSLILTTSSAFTVTNLTINTVGTGTLTSNGKYVAALTVNHAGTTTLADAFTTSATATTTLTAGTLDLGGFTLTTGAFSSNNTNTRAVAFGSGSIVLTQTTAGSTVLSMANATGFSVSGTGGFNSVMSTTRTFTFGTTGGSVSNAPSLTLPSGSSVATLTGGSWFNKLDFGSTSTAPNATSIYVRSLVLGAASTYTNITPTFVGDGTVTPNGKALATVAVNGDTTITSGGSTYFNGTTDYVSVAHNTALDLTSGDFTVECWAYITATSSNMYMINKSGLSGSTVGAYTIQYRSTDSTWSFTTSNSGGGTTGTFYTFGSGSNKLNTWMHFAVTRSGTTIRTFLDGVLVTTATQGTAITDAGRAFLIGSQVNGGNYFSGYISNARVVKGTALYTATFAVPTTSLAAVTNTSLLVLQDATTTDNSANAFAVTLFGTPSPNVNDPFPNTVYSVTTTTFAGSLTASGFILYEGTMDITGVTITSPTFTAGSIANARSIIGGGTGVITVSGSWTATSGIGFTGSGYTINMTNASAKTFAGGGGAYGKLVQAGAGALTITGSNSFEDIQATTRPSTITVTAGTTQNLGEFTLSGVSGSLVTVNSTAAGTQFTMRKTAGTASPNYISIRDSNVIGGAYWNLTASGTNTNVSNNTGWDIILNKILGQFMTFFF